MGQHEVTQGDCISSIAEEHGFHWQTIWKHPQNAELKRNRKDPNVLYPGDIVFIPDKTQKNHPAATDKWHRFVRKGVPAVLRLQLLDVDHKPRANTRYVLNVDGTLHNGVTDSEGLIEHVIPPKAQRASLRIQGAEQEDETYELSLGHVDPITKTSGVRQRLVNLGFPSDDEGEEIGESTAAALRAFQRKVGIQETGQADQATRDRLVKLHGS